MGSAIHEDSPDAAMQVASEPQGEAVADPADGHACFTTSEGADPPPYRVADCP